MEFSTRPSDAGALTPPFPDWEAVQILLLGADADDRERVREVLRELRVLALLNDRPDLEIRVALRGGRVAVAAGGSAGDEGPTREALRDRLAEAAPRGLVLDGSERDVPGSDAELVSAPFEDAAAQASTREAIARWAAEERSGPVAGAAEVAGNDASGDEGAEVAGAEGAEDEALVPSVILTDADPLAILDEARRTPLPIAVVPLGTGELRMLAYRAPAGQGVWLPGTSVSLAAEDPARGIDLQVLSRERDVLWAPGTLSALALPGVEMRAGAVAEFVTEALGAGSVARVIVEALQGAGLDADVAELRSAIEAPPSRQATRLVEALGLPPSAARLLRGEIAPEALVAGHAEARLVQVDGVMDAALELLAQEMEDSTRQGGFLSFYRELVLERPRLLSALVAVEAGVGALLTGGAVRAAARGAGGRGSTVGGVVGGLLLVDALAEGLVAREMRVRHERGRAGR